MINCADKDICNSGAFRHFSVEKWEDKLKAENILRMKIYLSNCSGLHENRFKHMIVQPQAQRGILGPVSTAHSGPDIINI